MATLRSEQISFTAFGVAIDVIVPARLEAAARALLPPGAQPATARGAASDVSDALIVSIDERAGTLQVANRGSLIGETGDDALALGMLDAQIRAQVALLAPEHIFVHAGVVAVRDQAIVLPGFTFAGKTTLTRALVQAGATYYSDEFAVLDADGRVHPYPKPLSIRHADDSGRTTETPAAALGAETGEVPVPVGLVAVTSYQPGAALAPEPLNSGAALLALLGHTIPARGRPRQAMRTLKAAVRHAGAWKSERGEAAEAARAIIAAMP